MTRVRRAGMGNVAIDRLHWIEKRQREMIEITEAAAKRIREAMVAEGRADGGLRVGVKAGGCNGMSYVFRWEDAPRSTDQVFETAEGTRVFVDPKSLTYLDGTVLDCDPNMLGQSLVFRNPNATSECGCGLSFNVES